MTAPSGLTADVAILGAGMAGLTAARELQLSGRSVLVIDKGRGVGGRLATRRVDEAVLDHGAQFFTVRGDDFASLINEAEADGVVEEWCRGFGVPDGYPRWRGAAGMTSLAKWMASTVDVRVAQRAERIDADDDGVKFIDETGNLLASAPSAIVTSPLPQTLELFANGSAELPVELAADLAAVDWFATLALLVLVEGDHAVPEPGGLQLDDGPFTFIADNHRKGISPVTALTFHGEHGHSRRRFDDDPEDVHRELLERAAPWIGEARVVTSQLKKWRYAGPVQPLPNATELITVPTGTIALAGDAFAGPKVEGAFNSGLAAARAI